MPRVKLFNQEKAVEKAMNLFWEKGYASTSLTDLTINLKISKGSFYDTFNSKRELFELCFELYRSTKIEQLEVLLNSEPDIRLGLEKLMFFNLENFLLDHKHKGCFLSNTCSEMGGNDEFISQKLLDNQVFVSIALVNYIKQDYSNASDIANLVLTFLTGMSQEVKFRKDRNSYKKSISLIIGLLEK